MWERELCGTVGVHLGDVEPELPLRGEGVGVGRRDDPQSLCDGVSRIGQDREGQLVFLLRAEGTVGPLGAEGDEGHAPLLEGRHQFLLIRPHAMLQNGHHAPR